VFIKRLNAELPGICLEKDTSVKIGKNLERPSTKYVQNNFMGERKQEKKKT
jgi:hypothetical protein